MARSKDIGELVAEVSGAAGRAASTQNSGWRVPKWAYVAGGLAALAAVAYGAVQLATAAPQPRSNAQPTVVATPYRQPTPVPGIENLLKKEEFTASVEGLLSFERPLTYEDKDVWQKAAEANTTAYFTLTGRTTKQDGLGIKIMTREEYDATVHPQLKGTAGTAFYGKDGIIYAAAIGTPRIDESSARTLLLIVANELGNAKDSRVIGKVLSANPDPEIKRTGDPYGVYEGRVLGEASKHLYQAAVLHLIKESGIEGISIADIPENKENIRVGLERSLDNGALPIDGWLVSWWYALNDSEARQELEKNGELSSRTALKVHNAILAELVASIGHPENYQQKVQGILANKTNLQQQILDASYKRLSRAGQIRNVKPGDMEWLFVP